MTRTLTDDAVLRWDSVGYQQLLSWLRAFGWVRIHHLIPSMSCRFSHSGGRPSPDTAGSSTAGRCHWASVRPCRLVTATLATRSPV